MDFLKILKSFEDFIYEALIWIILLPKTLARIVAHPCRMTDYAAAELGREDENRFSEEITPPLLLILCVLIAHFVDLGIRNHAQIHAADGSLSGMILGSEQNLLLYRTIAFGIWAIAGAAFHLLHTGRRIGRANLRQPFYQQCYLVAPFALVQSVAISVISHGRGWMVAGVVAALTAIVWFWIVQIIWIRRTTGLSVFRSALTATLVVLTGAIFNAIVGGILTSGLQTGAEKG